MADEIGRFGARMEEDGPAEKVERLIDVIAGSLRDDLGADALRALRELADLASTTRRCPNCGSDV